MLYFHLYISFIIEYNTQKSNLTFLVILSISNSVLSPIFPNDIPANNPNGVHLVE